MNGTPLDKPLPPVQPKDRNLLAQVATAIAGGLCNSPQYLQGRNLMRSTVAADAVSIARMLLLEVDASIVVPEKS